MSKTAAAVIIPHFIIFQRLNIMFREAVETLKSLRGKLDELRGYL